MKKQDVFGEDVFDLTKIKRHLGGKTYRTVCRANCSDELPAKTAQKYAERVRKWAASRGAVRYTHRFQPLNNSTAGKRDSLVSLNRRGNTVVKFRNRELQNGEGDASSFPNGGIRQTFEARGITRWDFTCFCYVADGCLCVPATFTDTQKNALDKKTPLLRSVAALNKQALRLLKILRTNCRNVCSVVGAEQEYFLVDKHTYLRRPDLVYTGRTLWGSLPPKSQQLQDHYYRAPNQKVLEFWREVDAELNKLGIVVKTEHREVAPSQFELAPCYTPVQLASEQNQLVMETLQKVAGSLDLVCLLHEKPFDNLNGSGKHNNWSLLTDTDVNLFCPGTTAKEHARFLLFLAAVVAAVDEHADLLRFSVASAGNDCRLGGFEAPPQVISVFLGDLYPTVLQAVNNPHWQMGKHTLPALQQGTDRNRTSPFAFTGNKFEFRMVGSAASLADCNTVLNVAMADVLGKFADRLQNSANLWQDAKLLVSETLAAHGKVVYNGNNYSTEWLAEAQKRGLPQFTDTPQAIACLTAPKNAALFTKEGVFSMLELSALQQAHYQNYAATVTVEANTLCQVCTKNIVPATEKYVSVLSQTATNKVALGVPCRRELSAIKKASVLADKLSWHTCKLKKLVEKCSAMPLRQQAEFACETIIPQMHKMRQLANVLEQLCPAEFWNLPTYGDLLYGSCNN